MLMTQTEIADVIVSPQRQADCSACRLGSPPFSELVRPFHEDVANGVLLPFVRTNGRCSTPDGKTRSGRSR